MKIKALIILAGLALSASAHADMSAENSRSATVNGTRQSTKSDLSVSDFNPDQIGVTIKSAEDNGEGGLYAAAVPAAPFPDAKREKLYTDVLAAIDAGWNPAGLTPDERRVFDMLHQQMWAIMRELPGQSCDSGPDPANYCGSTVAAKWALWAIAHGWISRSQYAMAFQNLLLRFYNPAGNYLIGSNPSPSFMVAVIQVAAYIQAYAVSPTGFAGQNLLGFVPLCEAKQANDCNITGGSFTPRDTK